VRRRVFDVDADALTKWLLVCGAVSGFGFIAVVQVEGAVRPYYDPLSQPVSMLSLGVGGWIQIANFVVTGLLMLACAVGLWRALSTGRAAIWGPILIGMNGLGLIGAGAFNVDPGHGYPPKGALGVATAVTWHGQLHSLTSLIAFVSMALACFVFARRFAAQPGGRLWAAYSLLTGLAVLIFLVAASVVLSGNGEFGGLLQRTSIYAGRVWIGLLAISIALKPGHEPNSCCLPSYSPRRSIERTVDT
jgi:hypothetical protein